MSVFFVIFLQILCPLETVLIAEVATPDIIFISFLSALSLSLIMLSNNFCSVSEEIFLNLKASVPSLTDILLKVSNSAKTFLFFVDIRYCLYLIAFEPISIQARR